MTRGLSVLRVRQLTLVVLLLAATAVAASAEDRWLHIKVDDSGGDNEMVRVNVPLSLAEKVLPCVHAENFDGGKVRIQGNLNDVDLRQLVEAIRDAGDNEFVTVRDRHEDVRIAKAGGNLLIKVREKDGESKREQSTVDIKVPFTVVQALLSAGKDELDVAAAIRALRTQGNTELVTVNDKTESVRIWVDSRSASE
ncbi:MAG TPA: hypothetical protein VG204_02865 [Terriglobia bacterium]|nr:hypothetical protein [Terriglobia bacterium]